MANIERSKVRTWWGVDAAKRANDWTSTICWMGKDDVNVLGLQGLTGLKADMMIIDDPIADRWRDTNATARAMDELTKQKPGQLTWGSFHDGFGMTAKEKEETHMSDAINNALREMEARMVREQERNIFNALVYGRDPHNPFHRAFDRVQTSTPVKPGGTVTVNGIEYIVKGVKPKAAVKPVKKDYSTLGVRFLNGPNLEKIYTYKVKKGARLHLGQEIVVPTTRDGKTTNTIAVIVELHASPQDTMNLPNGYGWVAGTVKSL